MLEAASAPLSVVVGHLACYAGDLLTTEDISLYSGIVSMKQDSTNVFCDKPFKVLAVW